MSFLGFGSKRPRLDDVVKQLDSGGVTKEAKDADLVSFRGVLGLLHIHKDDWKETVETLAKAKVRNVDDLMVHARLVAEGNAKTVAKLEAAGLDDAFLAKLRAFATLPGV